MIFDLQICGRFDKQQERLVSRSIHKNHSFLSLQLVTETGFIWSHLVIHKDFQDEHTKPPDLTLHIWLCL